MSKRAYALLRIIQEQNTQEWPERLQKTLIAAAFADGGFRAIMHISKFASQRSTGKGEILECLLEGLEVHEAAFKDAIRDILTHLESAKSAKSAKSADLSKGLNKEGVVSPWNPSSNYSTDSDECQPPNTPESDEKPSPSTSSSSPKKNGTS